ncbi:hypothetical protein I551_3148 [Mycobacterium ulcerans str. Harvey]|uniref:Uncharacterized protein n=1 Tax=Mycobacterium ulcerans str. Harvey TaxID=1299332 RepID=A0ABP3AKJ7_MYCUL|nr:hypothetical protein I551_3148 [Mycobacterium ulcerans str. Harvey]
MADRSQYCARHPVLRFASSIRQVFILGRPAPLRQHIPYGSISPRGCRVRNPQDMRLFWGRMRVRLPLAGDRASRPSVNRLAAASHWLAIEFRTAAQKRWHTMKHDVRDGQ